MHLASATAIVLIVLCTSAHACDLSDIGSGRVASVADGRTLRLDDGRDIRLIGLELPRAAIDRQRAAETLAALAVGKTVTLRAETDAPDRYGRQHAMLMIDRQDSLIQAQLLARGAALVSPLAPSACASALRSAEAEAHAARAGIWASSTVIKSTESPGDILAAVGQFGVVEGTVRSVREAGGVTYVNFGRRWTEDFAATLTRRTATVFDSAGVSLKTLENRRVRIRGWISQRTGPRIEVFRVEQIEAIGDNESRSGHPRGFGRGADR